MFNLPRCRERAGKYESAYRHTRIDRFCCIQLNFGYSPAPKTNDKNPRRKKVATETHDPGFFVCLRSYLKDSEAQYRSFPSPAATSKKGAHMRNHYGTEANLQCTRDVAVNIRPLRSLVLLLVTAGVLCLTLPHAARADGVGFFQTNLTSDIPGLAAFTDP